MIAPPKRKLNTNSVDFHVAESVSTQANSQTWEEPVSLRKGSEQLHTFPSDNANPAQHSYNMFNQHFEGPLSDSPGGMEGFNPPLTRKRLYSHYERISNDSPVETKNRTDDYLTKYKTEMCKNFEFKGECHWGDTVS